MMRTGSNIFEQAHRIWTARLLIGLVLFFNVQCAVVFLIAPESYAPGFELNGPIGAGMVQGMGLLFLMWNVPYAVAVTDPLRHRISLYEAIVMQAIGFGGESLLLAIFPPGFALLRVTMGRFILFDGAGLILLVLAALITARRFHTTVIV